MTVAAIVLAGGGGSRFVGDHKLVTPFRGRPLAAWAIEAALGSGADEVIVVTGAVDLADLVSGNARVVANPRWSEGQATSLAAGIDAAETAGHDAAVVGLADQPLIPAEAWRRVTRCAESPIVVATYDGVRRNPVRFDRQVWSLLPREGDEGARGLLKSRPDLVTEVACPGDPIDIDTQQDLMQHENGAHSGDASRLAVGRALRDCEVAVGSVIDRHADPPRPTEECGEDVRVEGFVVAELTLVTRCQRRTSDRMKQREPTTGAHDPGHLREPTCRVGEVREKPGGEDHIERALREWEPPGIAEYEPRHRSTPRSRRRVEHLRRDVEPDDRTRRAHGGPQRVERAPSAAAEIEHRLSRRGCGVSHGPSVRGAVVGKARIPGRGARPEEVARLGEVVGLGQPAQAWLTRRFGWSPCGAAVRRGRTGSR